jgi:hypothetical protein
MTELNNHAQSNYDRFVSATGSPSIREETAVEVGNPYNQPTRVWIIGQQSNPAYRTYLDSTWLLLEAGETRRVRVMLEYALDPRSDDVPADVRPFAEQLPEFLRRPNDVGLHAYAEDPTDEPRHALELLGGADVQVATGRATKFERFDSEGRVAFGTVVTADDRVPVPGGQVLVTFAADPDSPDDFLTVAAALEEGSFQVAAPRRWKFARADHLPELGLGPATTEWIQAG